MRKAGSTRRRETKHATLGTGGGAGYDAGLGGDELRFQRAAAVDAVDDAADRSRRDPVKAGIHGGQRRLEIRGFLVVVEADHLHPVGHRDAVRRQSEQRAQRELVVERHDAIERNAGVDDMLRHARARADGPILADVGH